MPIPCRNGMILRLRQLIVQALQDVDDETPIFDGKNLLRSLDSAYE